jgi:nitrite reductase (NADH) large subunit
MVAVLEQKSLTPASEGRPIVIVGCGPVGARTAGELERRGASVPIIVYGAEAEEPYNRVRLSSLLAGEIPWASWVNETMLDARTRVQRRLGCAVTSIDREARTVCDASGVVQPYSHLIIATGSTPHVPNIPNTDLQGVYTFRDLKDVQQLFARAVRSRRTVVLGGGLLGLEAARAMRRFHTQVIVVEHASRPMPRQLDDEGGRVVATHLKRIGIDIVLGEGARRIIGDCRVSGIELMSGAIIECDTVVVATGIRPNIDLARRAGLSVGRGIRVDDQMRTSDPSIFAVGECAEHREHVYGLVAPGYEQAAVVASVLTQGVGQYRGSLAATRLKVVGVPVFSIGRVADDDLTRDAKCSVHRLENRYCKIAIEKGRLVGAIAIGDAAQVGRLQEAVTHARTIWPWQVWRFRRTGILWAEQKAQSVRHWPDHVAVCNCMGVSRGALGKAIDSGAKTVADLAAATGASSVCGSCKPLLAELCGQKEPLAPEKAWRPLLGTTGVAALLAVLLLFPMSLNYASSVQSTWSLDFLWRSSFWKQLTGYTTVAFTTLALLMSFRKRIKRISFGTFAYWRIVHVALAVIGLAALIAHTGGRLGSNLNAMLMGSFVAISITGVAAAAILGLQHKLSGDHVRWRSQLTWAHILLFWPVPVLLGFHIFKSYYF